MKPIAFQGLPGAYSELAIRQHFPGGATRGFETFNDVHQALRDGTVDDALLPFENSVAGTIDDNFELMVQSPFQICGESTLRVQHCVLALPGAKDIRRVLSHPQALAQCRAFSEKRGWVQENFFDTAGAALYLKENPGFLDAAVIASEEAARLHGLEVLHRDVADRPGNCTRFFHLRREALPLPTKGIGRALIMLSESKRGAFADFMNLAAKAQVKARILYNLATRQEAWTFHYFCELETAKAATELAGLLPSLKAADFGLKSLGCFGDKGNG